MTPNSFGEYGFKHQLSEFFLPHRVPGRELSDLLSAYYSCANANSPSFSQNSPSLPKNSVSSLWGSKGVAKRWYMRGGSSGWSSWGFARSSACSRWVVLQHHKLWMAQCRVKVPFAFMQLPPAPPPHHSRSCNATRGKYIFQEWPIARKKRMFLEVVHRKCVLGFSAFESNT